MRAVNFVLLRVPICDMRVDFAAQCLSSRSVNTLYSYVFALGNLDGSHNDVVLVKDKPSWGVVVTCVYI